MKSANQWAPVSTVSGKVDGGGLSTAPGSERVEPAPAPCAPEDVIVCVLEAHEAGIYSRSVQLRRGNFAKPPPVAMPAGELEEVLSLMLDSALQAMPQGGILWVLAYEKQRGAYGPAWPSSAAITPGRFVVLAVKDSGAGTEPDLTRIRELVEKRGGGVSCSAAPGWGVRVNVYLRAA